MVCLDCDSQMVVDSHIAIILMGSNQDAFFKISFELFRVRIFHHGRVWKTINEKLISKAVPDHLHEVHLLVSCQKLLADDLFLLGIPDFVRVGALVSVPVDVIIVGRDCGNFLVIPRVSIMGVRSCALAPVKAVEVKGDFSTYKRPKLANMHINKLTLGVTSRLQVTPHFAKCFSLVLESRSYD